MERYRMTTARLNLREAPGLRHQSLGVMDQGILVADFGDRASEDGYTWAKISPLEGPLMGRVGWSATPWLSPADRPLGAVLAVDAAFSPIQPHVLMRHLHSQFRQIPELFIQCMWTGAVVPSPALSNLRLAQQAAMDIAIYVNPYKISDSARLPDPYQPVERAQNMLGELWEKLIFVAVDVERLLLPESQPSAARIQATLKATLDMVEHVRRMGKIPVLYTGAWFWNGVLGNPKPPELDGVAAWLAQYDHTPDLSKLNTQFGPRWRVAAKQFAGTTSTPGGVVDLNVFALDFVQNPT